MVELSSHLPEVLGGAVADAELLRNKVEVSLEQGVRGRSVLLHVLLDTLLAKAEDI